MTTFPTARPLPAAVIEPFRSDPAFWRSLRADVLALVVILAGAVTAAALALTAGGALVFVPGVVSLVAVGWAGALGIRSSRKSRAAFPVGPDGRRAWRDAERQAVAHGFLGALRGAGRS